jgi:hypothetical protein
MDHLPTNPHMLVSAINMLLRDGEFESLEDLCRFYDRNEEELQQELQANGFVYDTVNKQFR